MIQRRHAAGANGTVRFAVVSDAHLGNAKGSAAWHNPQRLDLAEELFQAALRTAAAHHADALVVLGDLTDAGDALTCERALDLVDAVSVPAFLVPGNHDVASGDHVLESVVARHAGSLTLLSGEGVRLTPWLALAGTRVASADREFHARTLDLPPTVARSETLVWASHFPVFSMADALEAAGLADAGQADNPGDVAAALPDSGPVVCLTGHLHVRAFHIAGRILQWSQPALVEPPHEMAIFEIRHTGSPVEVSFESIRLLPPQVDREPVLCPPYIRFILGAKGWTRQQPLAGS